MKRILLIAERRARAQHVQRIRRLERSARIACASNLPEILAQLEREVDLVVIDGEFASAEGISFSFCRMLRWRGVRSAIVLLLDAYTGASLMSAFASGVDDVVAKSASPEEFHARLSAAVARGHTQTVLECGDLSLDLRTQQAKVSGRFVSLSRHHALLLTLMLGRAQKAVPAPELCLFADIQVNENYKNLNNEIQRLRERLAEVTPLAGRQIRTVRKVGYGVYFSEPSAIFGAPEARPHSSEMRDEDSGCEWENQAAR